jgi:Small acidic protein family
MRLMGGKKKTESGTATTTTVAAGPEISDRAGMKIQKGLEKEFEAGRKLMLEKRKGKRVGLGNL